MITLKELQFSEPRTMDKRKSIPDGISGIYLFLNEKHELMYIGKSENIRSRINSHLSKGANTSEIYHNFKEYRYAELTDPVDREIYETYYINLWKPKLNQEKTFTYRTSFYDKQYNNMAGTREQQQQIYNTLADLALQKHIKLL